MINFRTVEDGSTPREDERLREDYLQTQKEVHELLLLKKQFDFNSKKDIANKRRYAFSTTKDEEQIIANHKYSVDRIYDGKKENNKTTLRIGLTSKLIALGKKRKEIDDRRIKAETLQEKEDKAKMAIATVQEILSSKDAADLFWFTRIPDEDMIRLRAAFETLSDYIDFRPYLEAHANFPFCNELRILKNYQHKLSDVIQSIRHLNERAAEIEKGLRSQGISDLEMVTSGAPIEFRDSHRVQGNIVSRNFNSWEKISKNIQDILGYVLTFKEEFLNENDPRYQLKSPNQPSL